MNLRSRLSDFNGDQLAARAVLGVFLDRFGHEVHDLAVDLNSAHKIPEIQHLIKPSPRQAFAVTEVQLRVDVVVERDAFIQLAYACELAEARGSGTTAKFFCADFGDSSMYRLSRVEADTLLDVCSRRGIAVPPAWP